MRLTIISNDKAKLFEKLMGLEKGTLENEEFKGHVFQQKHSLILFTGALNKTSFVSPSQIGIIFAEWIGERSLKLFPSSITIFAKYFQNIVLTDYPFFINGRNLPPDSYRWLTYSSESRRVLVMDLQGTPLGIGLKKKVNDNEFLLINEINIGDFLKKEKKAKRRFR